MMNKQRNRAAKRKQQCRYQTKWREDLLSSAPYSQHVSGRKIPTAKASSGTVK